MLSLNPAKPNLQVFADTLLDLAQKDPSILAVTCDSRGSARLGEYGKALPDQIIEIGIAEQNLVGVSAGLASAGKKVFAVSPGSFLTARALEQIKNDVAYSDQPVKLVGISAGVSYGSLGSTHHTLHDFAVFQAINNIAIVVPADNFETEQAVRAAVDYPHPIYLRFGKKAMPDLHPAGSEFKIGKAAILRQGSDVSFIACGETVLPAYQAAGLLEEQGISCTVLSMHTLRPFDEEAVLEAAHHSQAVITVEEHSVYGGLGSRVASLLMQKRVYIPMHIVGFPDEYTMTGSQPEIFAYYGITPIGLQQIALALLGKKN